METGSRSRVRFASGDPEVAPPTKRARRGSIVSSARAEPSEALGVSRHPLGVLPSGNSLLNSASEKTNRHDGLGLFCTLPDAALLSVLGSLDANILLTLGALSRTLYAFASHEPLWKELYILRAKGRLSRWDGTWKRTYIRTFGRCPADVAYWPTKDIRVYGVYSDDLFQPTICSHTSLVPYFFPHSTRPRSTIARQDTSTLSRKPFSKLYARRSTPVLISGAMRSWSSCRDGLWSMDSLERRFDGIEFRAEAFDVPFHVYRRYSDDCDEEDSPLYLFDSRFVEKTGGAMGEEYMPFPFFGRDLFELLGPERPDYRWLIVGPARSGSTFHKDPNGTSAWNAVLTGRKGWIMFPPNIRPPGVYTNEDESEVTSPLSIPEWFLTYFDYAWTTYGPHAKNPETRGKMIIGVCGAGEVVYVPSGWWHLVVNLEESVAVTQNFVSEDELLNVLRFMRHKPDQVSGLKGDLSAEVVYERFTAALRREAFDVSKDALEAMDREDQKPQKESLWVKVVEKTKDKEEETTGFSFGFDVDDLEE